MQTNRYTVGRVTVHMLNTTPRVRPERRAFRPGEIANALLCLVGVPALVLLIGVAMGAAR